MESDAFRQEIDDIHRHRLEVYNSTVAVPWAFPALAAAVFVLLASFELRSPWVPFAVLGAFLAFLGIATGMLTRRVGVQPRLRGMPKPLLAETVRFSIGYALVIWAMVPLGFAVSFLLAGALAGVATVVGGRRFERRYRRLADALVAGSTPSR